MSALLRRKRREEAKKAKTATSKKTPRGSSSTIVEEKVAKPAPNTTVRRNWLGKLVESDENPGEEAK